MAGKTRCRASRLVAHGCAGMTVLGCLISRLTMPGSKNCHQQHDWQLCCRQGTVLINHNFRFLKTHVVVAVLLWLLWKQFWRFGVSPLPSCDAPTVVIQLLTRPFRSRSRQDIGSMADRLAHVVQLYHCPSGAIALDVTKVVLSAAAFWCLPVARRILMQERWMGCSSDCHPRT